MTNIVVSIVPVDGAGTSAGTAMDKFDSSIFTNPALELLTSIVK